MNTDSIPESDALQGAKVPNRTPDWNGGEGENPEWVDLVARQVASLRFGTVQIVVHDGRVTQVESTEKIRLAGN